MLHQNKNIAPILSHSGSFEKIAENNAWLAMQELAAKAPIGADRLVEIDPAINRPLREAEKALAGDPSVAFVLDGLAGILALLLLDGDEGLGRLVWRVMPWKAHDMTDAITAQLKQDIGDDARYLGLFYEDGYASRLLAMCYPARGLLVPAAGIGRETVEGLGAGFLKWDDRRGQALWTSPAPCLTADQQERLGYMMESLYPGWKYPGAAKWLEHNGISLTKERLWELAALVRTERLGPEAADYLQKAAPLYTPPVYPLPEVFMDKLCLKQVAEKAPDQEAGTLGGRARVKNTAVHLLPPVTEGVLQDKEIRLLQADYLVQGTDIEVTLHLDFAGARLTRRKRYTEDRIVDITAAPAALQLFHMANVSDEAWTGRLVLVTRFGVGNVHNLADLGYGRYDGGASLEECVGLKAECFRFSSDDADWIVCKTGIHTPYVTLLDGKGKPLCQLLTASPACSWKKTAYEGEGLISADLGTTTTHIQVMPDSLDDSTLQQLVIRAEELSQPIGPMSAEQFETISQAIGVPDFSGDLHPSAMQKFISDSPAGKVKFIGGIMRLLAFSNEDLKRLTDSEKPAGGIFLNMKGGNPAAEDAYTMMIASFIQLGYLWMLSRGQAPGRIRVLLAYPGEVARSTVYENALKMLERSLPAGTWLNTAYYAESEAAGAYIYKTKPEGVPVSSVIPLVVNDFGGTTSDAALYQFGDCLYSRSTPYAANIAQLSATLAVARKAHKGMADNWKTAGADALLQALFHTMADDESKAVSRALAGRIDRLMQESRNVSGQIDMIYDDKLRKLLEQLFRTCRWQIPLDDTFLLHWYQLWSLPVIDSIVKALTEAKGKPGVTAFVGAGSIFLQAVLQTDKKFDKRIRDYIMEKSGVSDHKALFVADPAKPEVAGGMIRLAIEGKTGELPDSKDQARRALESFRKLEAGKAHADRIDALLKSTADNTKAVQALSVRILVETLTRERYAAFLQTLRERALIENERHPEQCWGLHSVLDLLTFTSETSRELDSFEALVYETLEKFPLAAMEGAENTELILWLMAFVIANRNLYNLQTQ